MLDTLKSFKNTKKYKILNQDYSTRKLLLLPGGFNHLGGSLISLLLLVKGFEKCGASNQICVIVWSGSFTEKCLRNAGHVSCMQLIEAKNQSQFMKRALQWVNQQPKDFPLLLDNWSDWYVMPRLIIAAPTIRISRRPVYHFCHDSVKSYNLLGEFLRRIAFGCLKPKAICNSQFTANHIRRLMTDIQGILYQPVDFDKFNNYPYHGAPPKDLEPILKSKARIILTPSRLNKPGTVNDKNLRALIPVLAHLKAMGHFYHGVVIGPDESPDKSYSRALLETAQAMGVADCFTILQPTLNIEAYYKYASVVVTLAPREPFGRTVVEAIASGVPVIGSSTGGINEILQQFAPQWTVDPNNPADVALAIVSVASDSQTLDLLDKGQAWVKTHCEIANYAQKMMVLTKLIPSCQQTTVDVA
ncbi:glycosyltransferase family 4 protein [Aetokthonos hydrillicola Thurmond2011]|jgi:glycosyltransferase involved in cell wall biosynthesis|uniref:Glycosyltransferase family 4 protein n=1 Tax=Aetokthonos hydrillicola Thurmond2011 TaxID=2712845 RepID=A0AAP5I370_9CYAN|nr:glycosyltransferase family 4 protein [Aetokthonos hydrillicola]MBO3458288.1 glycosyltransferase family 4 protein [Aetokthonos hydrillicola CCALA 1050]MBW4585850.1 glycosyltransferase family 4 protein [Aetokthonos hydrillicola CCALA 1050]MDR9893924.1 glycosyltransferase family 4 protein [Aetokthonos hydrillicola Thurmond2011]